MELVPVDDGTDDEALVFDGVFPTVRGESALLGVWWQRCRDIVVDLLRLDLRKFGRLLKGR